MKITNQLPQFNAHPVLIIAADHYHSVFYEAYQGEIRCLHEETVEKTQYSDREDFARRPGGIIFESGARFEKRHRTSEANFERMFKSAYHRHFGHVRYDMSCIFAPEPIAGFIERVIIKNSGATARIPGMQVKAHPFDLLRKLQARSLPSAIRTMYRSYTDPISDTFYTQKRLS